MIEIEKVRDLNNDEVVVVIEASDNGEFACTVERYSEEYENQPNETDITDTAPPIQRF